MALLTTVSTKLLLQDNSDNLSSGVQYFHYYSKWTLKVGFFCTRSLQHDVREGGRV